MFDLNCQIFLNSHLPQVFLVLAIFTVLVKAWLLHRNTQEKDE